MTHIPLADPAGFSGRFPRAGSLASDFSAIRQLPACNRAFVSVQAQFGIHPDSDALL
jgi:hypothetical protein